MSARDLYSGPLVEDHATDYDSVYERFDSPLMRRVRADAYGDEDIGQHSWVTLAELREDVKRLDLRPSSRLLDLGCGPGGPFTFVLESAGCQGTALEVSATGVALAQQRVAALGFEGRASVRQADLNDPLPSASESFDAAIALDVVLHLDDRAALFREVRRVLCRGGRFLLTDAGVMTGAVSDAELASRSVHGRTRLVPPGFNDRALEAAGLRLLEVQDRTEALTQTSLRRLGARTAHRGELERAEGGIGFERQQHYLETVHQLALRRAVSRLMYLAESHGD